MPHRQIAAAADGDNVQIHPQRHDNFSTQPGFAKNFLDLADAGTDVGVDLVADLEFRLVFVRLWEQAGQRHPARARISSGFQA